MSTSEQKTKNRRWMKTNSNYLIANQDRFINKTLYMLQEDSKATILEKYKKAMKEFKKEDKLSIKIPLYKEAVKAGFRGSLATVTQDKLTKIIQKKKKTVAKKEEVVESEIIFEEDVINWKKVVHQNVFGNQISSTQYFTDYDKNIAIKEGMDEYYSKEDEKNHTYNRTKLTEENIPFMASEVHKKVMETIDNIPADKKKAGYNVYVITQFAGTLSETGDEKYSSTKSATGSNAEPITEEIIKQRIMESKPMYSQMNTDNYVMYLAKVHVVIYKLSTQGGCDSREHNNIIHKSKNFRISRRSMKSTNDNCLLMCFNKKLGISGTKLKPETVRNTLELAKGKIDVDQVPIIAKYYQQFSEKKLGYILCNSNFDLITQKESTNLFGVITKPEFNLDEHIIIQLDQDHYYLLDVEIIDMKECEKCGRKFENKHKCNINRESYHQTKRLKKRNMVRVKKLKEEELTDPNDFVFWDLETWQPENTHVAYASGHTTDGKYTLHYGQGCIDKAIDDFVNMDGKVISAFNGSGFDFYFLLNALLKRNADISGLIMSNGKLMRFTFTLNGKVNTIFDLYLFLNSSLEQACKDFKTEVVKGSFDHNKIQSWDDTQKYKKEVISYLRKDVESLKELFVAFNKMIHDEFGINVVKYFTLSHLAYDVWSSMLSIKVEIPDDEERYNYIRKTIYGGRCYPVQREYESSHYDEIMNGEMTHHDVLNSEDSDYVYNADVTSLYPASMSGTDLMKVYYPTGNSRWSEEGAKEFAEGKVGFYDIDFCPRKNLRVPIIPRHKDNGGIDWSLNNGSGTYNNVDIQNALDCGYKIDFTGKSLVYDSKSSILFTQYINFFFKMKNQAELEGNDVKRSVAKLLMNALYGKTLQRAIFDSTQIASNIKDFVKFTTENDLSSFEILDDNRVLLSGEIKKKDMTTKITKPCQLGSFVTAYSRKLMLHFMKEIDPTLTTHFMTYGDTDSMHLLGFAHQILLKKGLIMGPNDEPKLGYLNNDIKKDGLIIKEVNLAPKTYIYDNINNENKINAPKDPKNEPKPTMKAKGLPGKTLKADMYEVGKSTPCKFDGLKKINKRVSKKEHASGISHFSVVARSMTRTFNKTQWQGMNFNEEDGTYYPKGYVCD